ncbi:MAG: protein-L-isoaspartate(D-aspartate) O-methyltransferase [Fuerstiella sp.]|nr:protein-L-isoaspartate(D-aspartate) O-methyltransferase [Fuerstiella sp.]
MSCTQHQNSVQPLTRTTELICQRTAIRVLISGSLILLFGTDPTIAQRSADTTTAARHRLVDEAIKSEGISNEAVLRAMRKVRRHEFVLSGMRARAYRDEALPIGARQTISPPFVVAYMTQSLNPQPTDKVLEIGTGSGYQAAVLAEIVDQVYSIEIVKSLARSAERRLKRLGYDNVQVRAGDGYAGWPEHAPFDRIIVTCSPESVPESLVEQLRDGGTMIVPIGERYQQTFYLFRKKDGKLEQEQLISTLFVPMTGESEERRRILPNANQPVLTNGSFEHDINGDDNADGWHYQRRSTLVTESPMHGKRYLQFFAERDGELAQALQGMAVNGRRLGAVDLSCWVQAGNIKTGANGQEAGIAIHFYDAKRRELPVQPIARWRGEFNWQQVRRRVPIPIRAREMIIRIGLNGATGTLDLDDLRMSVLKRSQ